MSEAYRKVGRGGAGNFYSQKDIESASSSSRPKSPDLEAGKAPGPPSQADEPPSDPADPPAQSSSASSAAARTVFNAPTYARTGRGGAGNFVDPLSASSSSAAAAGGPIIHSTGNQSLRQPPSASGGRQSGRGGAGNWTTGEDEKKRVVDEEQERKRREAIDQGVFDDVKAGLQEPGRAHTRVHLHRGGVGSKERDGRFEGV